MKKTKITIITTISDFYTNFFIHIFGVQQVRVTCEHSLTSKSKMAAIIGSTYRIKRKPPGTTLKVLFIMDMAAILLQRQSAYVTICSATLTNVGVANVGVATF